MCGIIGYKGSKKDVIIEGLKKLEYRGYDSWGVASVSNGRIDLTKKVGKIGAARKVSNTALAIGHTRWATHGGVTEDNAHPQLSNNKKIAVIHNGIVENYQELRDMLKTHAYTFYSQTDTEVIPNLIQFYMEAEKLDFEEATKRTLARLEGRYAIVAVYAGSDVLIGARKGSPLVLGYGDNEYFIASDIPAFLDHAKKVSYLEDEDMVVIKAKPEIFNLRQGFYVQRPIDEITWSAEQIQKGNFDHYMIKEIMEQAETIQMAADTNKEKIKEIAREIKAAKKVIFVACGTAYHATRVAKYVFSKVANRNVSAIFAHELPQFKDVIDDKTLIVAVSQSGETADTLEVVKEAKEKNAKVVSITNVVGSTLARESQDTVPLNIGPEICVASTKAYTAQLAIITLLAYTLAGKFDEGQRLVKDMKRMVYYLTAKSRRDHVKGLAEKLKDTKSMFLLGRGLQYPTALEAALKIKEISYIHAEGLAGGELKHGSIALVEKGFPVVIFTSDDTEKDILSNASEVKARGAFVIGVGPKNNEIFDYFIKVEDAGMLNPILQIIPMQILAYELAVLKDLDPDKPRNLAKSVTVK